MYIARATRLGVITLAAALFAASAGRAATYEVVLDSPFQAGAPAQLAFDLTNGDGASNNAITLGSVVSDGSFGDGSVKGGAVGALPAGASLTDTAFLNELLQVHVLGPQLRFTIDTTTVRAGGSVPDQFSFFVLDAAGGILFDTTDPTGAGALFVLDLDGSAGGALRVFASAGAAPAPTWTVTLIPEPGTVALVGSGLALLAACARRGRA